jgi:hypothetical protein
MICFAFKPQNIIHINRWLHTHTHTREGKGETQKNKEKPKNHLSHILSPLKKKKHPNLFSLHQSSQNKEREEEKKKKEED